MKKVFSIFLLTILPALSVSAQTPLKSADYWLTMISPRYFGPYAFPVPDCNNGQIDTCMRIELAFDYVDGDMGDWTAAPTFKSNFPLWTDRASVTIGGEFHEWYKDTPESHTFRRIDDKYPLEGHDCGNIYFSIDIQALKERKYIPALALRAFVETASGGEYDKARHYDAAGYTFDLTAGKNFYLTRDKAHRIRVGAGIGFACWQIERGTQNDAFMINAGMVYSYKKFTLEACYNQYTGRIWHHEPDEGDRVQTFRAKAGMKFGVFTPFVYFQKGIHDWPFTMFRAGVNVSFPRLNSR